MNKIFIISSLSLSVFAVSHAFADNIVRHGYIDNPPSRAFLCSSSGGNKNQNCGSVQYEPQSVEGQKGFPEAGPPNGKLASGGNARFDNLNEQSSTRWKQVLIKSGKNTFSWQLTAAHRTTSWRYFITKQNWNPNKPLDRSDFDLRPFCEQYDDGAMPSDRVRITCNVPERNGYQVILGVWDIADTGNAFYQVIDANMMSNDGGNSEGNGGANGGGNGGNDEDIELQDREYLLKAKIEKKQLDYGNSVSYYLKVESDAEPYSKTTFKWLLPENAEDIVNSENTSSFSILKQNRVQEDKARITVTAGKEYKIFIENINVPELNSERKYDYIYPDNLKYYIAGTKVYQPYDKQIYQCRPFPYSGYCQQWKSSANQYEPGVGFAWTEAWVLID